MPLRPRNPTFVIVSVFLLSIAGCAANGPEIDRYHAPTSFGTNTVVSEWSLDVWELARAGEADATINALLEPPVKDAAITSVINRFVILEAAAVSARKMEVADILSKTDPQKLDVATAVELSLLADLRAAGLPRETDHLAMLAIESSIDAWIKAAEAAETSSRFSDAEDAWSAVGSIAVGSDRPLALVEARRRQRRLNSLQDRGSAPSRKDDFGTERPTIDDALRAFSAILEFHVDSPTWKALSDAGFAQIAEAMPVMLKNSELAKGNTDLSIARSSFETATAGIKVRPGYLPSRVRRSLKKSLESMGSDDAITPLRPSVIARLFLDGAIAATDLRTNAFFGPQADEVRRHLEATYVGIGAQILNLPEGVFLQPISGSPAARAGIRDHDQLLAVDEERIKGRSSDSILSLVSGPIDTTVRLTISRAGVEDPLTLEVTRQEVERESVLGWRQVGLDDLDRPIWDWLIDAEAGIVFISIREFREDVIREFRSAFRDASDALGPDRTVAGLVLDLRNDPGGLRWVADDLLNLFISSGTIFSAEGRSAKIRSNAARNFGTRLEGLPVVVLVNESSASASEIVAGTLQAVSGAVVVGERTHGKGSVQSVRTLFNNGYAFVTESWFTIPDGQGGRRLIDRYRAGEAWGVEPNLHVGATMKETMAMMFERGRWHSGRSLDVPDPEALPISLQTTTDRELLLAVALLRARLLPTARPRELGMAQPATVPTTQDQ